MLRAERLDMIVDLVNKKGIVTIEDVMQELHISAATVRRDITVLSEKGAIQKIRGGATSKSKSSYLEPSFIAKKLLNYDEKRRIAKEALKYIQPGDKIILDSGTTVLELAKLIKNIENLTIVTNDLTIAFEVSNNPQIELLIVGGQLRNGYYSTGGYFAESMLDEISVDKSFLSADAIDPDQGIMSFTMHDINVKKQVVAGAKEVILLCDHSKFMSHALINLCRLDRIDRIIAGKELDPEIVERLRSIVKVVELV